jgi:hypothetical protein
MTAQIHRKNAALALEARDLVPPVAVSAPEPVYQHQFWGAFPLAQGVDARVIERDLGHDCKRGSGRGSDAPARIW